MKPLPTEPPASPVLQLHQGGREDRRLREFTMNVSYDGESMNDLGFVSGDVQDDLTWVLHNIQSLGLQCEEKDVTPPMLEVLQSLFSEVGS